MGSESAVAPVSNALCFHNRSTINSLLRFNCLPSCTTILFPVPNLAQRLQPEIKPLCPPAPNLFEMDNDSLVLQTQAVSILPHYRSDSSINHVCRRVASPLVQELFWCLSHEKKPLPALMHLELLLSKFESLQINIC